MVMAPEGYLGRYVFNGGFPDTLCCGGGGIEKKKNIHGARLCATEPPPLWWSRATGKSRCGITGCSFLLKQ